ncbi:uncharacterized protein LOC111409372 [Olea europaea var. sylvestris]|uniref:uncharacterized protein LOC111409372 n=1 Tax=Olea europaea var. sylvestris TaxID=158386 RepID=UPI000C1D42B0|nr:uncharacterized protein LOC111409372 [Olea europaea var. sylvestris]
MSSLVPICCHCYGGSQVVKKSSSFLSLLKCPMVGTFYKSRAPGEPPFVKVIDINLMMEKGKKMKVGTDLYLNGRCVYQFFVYNTCSKEIILLLALPLFRLFQCFISSFTIQGFTSLCIRIVTWLYNHKLQPYIN